MFTPIYEVEKKFPNWYAPDALLPYDDQKFIWENSPLPEEETQSDNNEQNGNVSVNGNVNGGYRLRVNSELIWYKSEAIDELTLVDHRTAQIKIASLLAEIFKNWPSVEGHWLYVAQTYTARTINWVIQQTIKEYLKGAIKTNPSKYFTYVIRKRSKRKIT